MKNAPGKGPLKGITEVFNKLRHDKPLEKNEISCLTRFIDEFFTVCTHSKVVGKDVAEIAKQVNQHHHTKTCRKHGTTCRFNYPKPPSPETLISSPYKKDKKLSFLEAQVIINRVMEVIENKDNVKKIMEEFSKNSEGMNKRGKGIESRIRMVCDLAEVHYDDYITSLKLSNQGYC